MNIPINRTTVQVEDNKYRVYPKGGPLFYKKSDGTYGDIDHTFNDTTSTIGDISLMDKGVVSVGKRKGNNPHKAVGIRPDNNQHLGTQQLEFSLINVELDGESQEFNVEDDLEIKLSASKVFQLVKINKDFKDFKIEFDIYAKGLELQNDKYSETTTIRDYEFNLTNLGEIDTSSTDLTLDGLFSENRDIPYIDGCICKITNNHLTTGQYSNTEEFGDSNLSNYILDNNLYENGSGMYYKDCLIFTAKAYNIENYENIIANDIADLYGCTLLKNDENHSEEEYMDGYYFIKDGKKIGGYFSQDNIFLAFFNTKDIPGDIKTLFVRKSFENTSYMDMSLNDFYTTINDRFNKDLKIEVNDDYYEPINDRFNFKVSKESFYIGLPIVFDDDYNELKLKTTHTLKDNADGSYRYTKYFDTDGLLNNNNNIKYIDTALYTSDSEDNNMYRTTGSGSSNRKTTAYLTALRDATVATNSTSSSASDSLYIRCGDNSIKSTAGKSTFYSFTSSHAHYIFDSSGITSTVSALSFKIRGGHKIIDTSSPHTDISVILLKSDTEGGNLYTNWNDYVGFTSGWDADDVTEYSAETVVTDDYGSPVFQTITLNSDAETDIEDDDTFKLAIIDYDQWYLNVLDTGYGVSETATRQFHANQIDATTTAYRPYLDVTTGAVAVTYNAPFFGTNF